MGSIHTSNKRRDTNIFSSKHSVSTVIFVDNFQLQQKKIPLFKHFKKKVSHTMHHHNAMRSLLNTVGSD
jgi:hypothetical protein